MEYLIKINSLLRFLRKREKLIIAILTLGYILFLLQDIQLPGLNSDEAQRGLWAVYMLRDHSEFVLHPWEIGFKVNNQAYLYSSIESSFRAPSYTELYLVSPTNVGDPSLQPERALSFEAGIKKVRGSILTNVNAFIRKEKNIIDWVRTTSSDPWLAANAGEITVKGVDLSIVYRPIVRMYKKFPIPTINLGYRLPHSELPKQRPGCGR